MIHLETSAGCSRRPPLRSYGLDGGVAVTASGPCVEFSPVLMAMPVMMLMMMLMLLLLILPPIGASTVDARVVQHILPPIVAPGEWKVAWRQWTQTKLEAAARTKASAVDEANEHTNVVVSSLLAQCSDHRGGICRSESTSSADEESAGIGVDDQQAGQKRAQARGIPERD